MMISLYLQLSLGRLDPAVVRRHSCVHIRHAGGARDAKRHHSHHLVANGQRRTRVTVADALAIVVERAHIRGQHQLRVVVVRQLGAALFVGDDGRLQILQRLRSYTIRWRVAPSGDNSVRGRTNDIGGHNGEGSVRVLLDRGVRADERNVVVSIVVVERRMLDQAVSLVDHSARVVDFGASANGKAAGIFLVDARGCGQHPSVADDGGAAKVSGCRGLQWGDVQELARNGFRAANNARLGNDWWVRIKLIIIQIKVIRFVPR